MELSCPATTLKQIKIKLSSIRLRLLGSHRNFRRVDECKTILRWLNPQPGEKILDVGCGEGYLSEKIASRGALVKAIDLNPKAIASARNRVKNERLEFRALDATELDYPEAFFDKIVSFCVIEHFVDDEKVLSLLARMLKPGAGWSFRLTAFPTLGLRIKKESATKDVTQSTVFTQRKR